MKHKDEINSIIKDVGGVANIQRMTHCMTRLRFNLADDKKADLDAISKINGVLNTQFQNSQLQIVIGPAVADWYDEISNLTGIGQEESQETEVKEKKGFFSKLLEIFSNVFLPVIPAIAGAGMMKAILGLLSSFSLISQKSDSYIILNLMADATFYFLPFLLAISAAKLFKTNAILSAVLAGALLYPSLINNVGKISNYHFLGLPIPVINYSASVLPIILSVWIMSYLYRFVDKHMPDMLKVIFVPTVVLIIMIPIELIAIGPLGNYLGSILSAASMKLFSFSGALAGAILGGLRPLLVMTGMHQALTPIVFQNFASKGYDVLMPTMLVSTFAQATGVLTMVFKTRSKKEKSVIYASGISAILGITEPALYGVIVKYKRVLLSVCIGGGLGAAYVSAMGYHLGSFTPSNILSLAVYALMPKFIHVIIGLGIAIVSTALLVLVLQPKVGVEDEKPVIDVSKENTTREDLSTIDIFAPMEGDLVSLKEVPDTTFSSGAMGDGFAIIPKNGVVKAPFDGTIAVIAQTGHAVGIRGKNGIEVLIHVGIDTVELNGKFFQTYVTQGQKVSKGQKLISFDLKEVEKQYNIISPVIVTSGKVSLKDNVRVDGIDNNTLLAQASTADAI
ncbi:MULTISPECIES: beta-glucoside-specific PTS transporter subunit IIABC [unclassified Lactobacillus]|uniref:beta-glucoside-specific PTS transporter subunit IIABC n=1 Tax=unclassified Lactobacillus TaxID=2620435 RepID=UPI0018DB9448|nr:MULTISPECIES: beta-glucoside-specific PTS transporter subunit IIABC [unclassified Lactobacillus]MBH9990106.1 PTS glucose transporter subunit IIA [Lactobacillus sp. M0392]MBI0024563.1 PTS glucose transporter subunit IIA [Lactobacillus sp. W8171]MBI0045206.1 PTS glucose transporter subunit IIA [Lactobacillus sp. M0393]